MKYFYYSYVDKIGYHSGTQYQAGGLFSVKQVDTFVGHPVVVLFFQEISEEQYEQILADYKREGS